jgi:hypothetical protein
VFLIQQFPQFQFDFGYYDAQIGHVAIGLGIVAQKYAFIAILRRFFKKIFSAFIVTLRKKSYFYRFKTTYQ